MTYDEIIDINCNTNSSVSWWPRYAFHYTDVSNAIGILREGMIYSRFNATKKQLMGNDNASRQVIDMTYSGATSSVRFYYRPLTPTQFHNEGYKHPALRYCDDSNANVPVPIFFLFDLKTLLCMEGTQFSEQSLAGGGGCLYTGEEAFSKLNFVQIYKRGYMENSEVEKKYRHAEVVFPGAFPIDSCIKGIVCRNDIERATLLNLLRKKAPKEFSKYKDLVVVHNECFECNGLFITQCNYFGDKAAIVFSKTAKKIQYTSKYKNSPTDSLLLNAEAEFEWVHSGNMILRQGCGFQIDYENSEHMTFTGLNKPNGATALYMKIYIEKKLVCYMCWQLAKSALL